MMGATRWRGIALLAGALALPLPAWSQAGDPPVAPTDDDGRIRALEARLDAQAREIEALRNYLRGRDAAWDGGADGVDAWQLEGLRARGAGAGALPPVAPAAAIATVAAQSAGPVTVGQAPEESTRPPEVAQIFDQPGVLTPAGTLVLEPSLQTG